MSDETMTSKELTDEEHRQLHVTLHDHLDVLVADMIRCTGMSVGVTTVEELMAWSYEQTKEVE